jgi:hexosaminidase
VPDGLTPAEEQLIMGAEACLWTERLNKSEWLETMTFPRLCALAEITWSPKSSRDFDDFSKRMQTHRQRLDMARVAYFRAGKAEPKLADVSQEAKHSFVTGP